MENIDKIILENEKLVRAIVRQYPVPSIDPEDLMQEGRLGLVEAIRNYDPSKNVTFQSYAAWWVRKYVLEGIRVYGYIIKLPQRNVPEKIFTEELDKIVAVEDGEVLTYEDVLRAPELQPDEMMELKEGLEAWQKMKKSQKITKKRLDVGKWRQKYVNK